ncbi:hypothetical protein [Flavobacterium psychrophilum]|uniref:hypothetical protein n=1 Tax=Flavobacterium psychrophilum TaxID=96345 RepID=UPI000B7C3FF2|nr:hypothetical protein [Flavobacterium psychrophilum]MCB6232051.1 hypothetical protein [Flavobacterium psychrophilum]SNB20265.1 conserved hypothetical protein [Flavobacterium psychrophilum]
MASKFLILTTSIFVLLLSNCNNKKNIVSSTIQKNDYAECKVFFDKYKKKMIIEENDSALIYIDKAIKCNPNNNSYKNSKVNFLISIKNYKEADKQLDELITITNDPAFRLLKGIIKLKDSDPQSEKLLVNSYDEFNQIKKPTSSNLIYKIALDNYFKGKDYSLNQVEEFKQTYKDKPYENQNIEALQELINKETKEIVLFKLFNIND